jgi:large repetitive protein
MGKKLKILLSLLIVFQMFIPNILNGSVLAAELTAPNNLSATQSYPGNVTLGWSSVPFSTKYKVYKITNETKQLVSEVTTNSASIVNLPEGTHTYAVSAATSSKESTLSTPVTFEVVYPEMKSPSNFSYSIQNLNDIVLSWQSSQYANMYHIYQINGDTKNLVTKTNSLTYTLERMPEGKYTYEITAFNSRFGESAVASKIEVELKYPVIVPPVNLQLSVDNGNDITLKWDKALNANQYYIYRVINGTKNYITKTSSNTITFTNMPEGSYLYEITSNNLRIGESALGSQVELQNLVFPKMNAPTNLAYSIRNETDIRLNWTATDYATSYNVYQLINGERKFLRSTTATSYTSTFMTKGTYQYEVTAFSDRFGVSEASAFIDVELTYADMEAPTALTSTLRNGNDIVLKWNPSVNATYYNIYHVINGDRKLVRTVEGMTSAVFTKMPEGTYQYEVTSYNTRFGESPTASSTEIKIGNVDILAPLNLTYSFENINDVVLKWDPSVNANSYKIYKVGNGVRELIEATADTTFTLMKHPEGQFVYEVTAVSDRFGESEKAAKVEFNLIYPELLPPSNLSYSTLNINDLTLYWDRAEKANLYYIYQIDNGVRKLIEKTNATSISYTMFPEGHYVYEVTSYSTRIGESKQATRLELDIKYPILEAPVLSYSISEDNLVVLNWSKIEHANSYSVYQISNNDEIHLIRSISGTSLILSELEDGDYVFAVQAKSSRFGESSLSNLVNIPLESDKTPPTTLSNITGLWENQAFIVNLSATDDKSGVAKTFYSINNSDFVEGTSFTVNEDGIFQISFYSVDNAGNVEQKSSAELKIDKNPPETTSNVSDQWVKGDFIVKLTAVDELSGVDKTYYSINGSEYVEGSRFSITTTGVNEVAFYSIDKAGNTEEEKTIKVKVDELPPETTSNAKDEWLNGTYLLELTATDDLSGVAKTLYSVNGSEFVEGTSVVVKKDGKNKVSFYSIDHAGNVEGIKTIEVNIDELPPETTSNAKDEWLKEAFILELFATDDQSGVAKTFYSVNGSDFVAGALVVLKNAGINKVSFYSVDNAGNVEEVKTVEVKIDYTAPETLSNIMDKWYKDKVSVIIKATDDLSGVSTTYYSINGSEFVEGTMFTVTQEGINKISYFSNDNAGNIEEMKTLEVRIDYTAPVVSWELAKEHSLDTALPLTYVAKDLLSGIASENILVNGQVYTKDDTLNLNQSGTYKIVVTVTDHAGWTTTLEKNIEVYIPASLVVNPGVIKANTGDFTVKVNLPKGFKTDQIDLSSATLNGVSAKSGTNGLIQQAKNGQFKFNRDDFIWSKGMVIVEFRVLINGYLVVGSTIVEVK